MEVLESFRAIARKPSDVARKFQADGGKVIGYRCQYVPEEIIWAAGMLPYPVYGTPEPIRLADSYFQSSTCEFVRNLFDQALEGKLDFLECLVLSNTCDVVRRLCDIWNAYIDSSPAYMINNPQKVMTEENHDFFIEELKRFKSRMEEIAGKPIDDDQIREAIVLHNETRTLLRDLYSLRQADPPALGGADALDVCMAVSVMPKDQANSLLRQLLDELKSRPAQEVDGPRILVTGSLIDNPALIQMIEEEGGVVVAEDLCNTIRYFWNRVDEDAAPMEAIYRFLNRRPLCACMHPMEARRDYLLGLVDEFDVDGVVNLNLKYCHPFLYEAPLFKKELEAREVPVNVLEVGHDLSGHGQLRTRIQAFIEMLDL